MRRTGWLILLSIIAASCARQPAADSSVRTFRLGLVPGAQDFVDFAMERHGILDRMGLQPERLKSLSPANLHLMLAEREVDIGFAGFTTMATARAEGKDVIVVHGVFSPVNMVFVRKDSPIRTVKDLQGKKLGVFGGQGSTTFTFLAVLARKWHDVDLTRQAEIVASPAPLLIELLGRGEIDAALLGTTESIQMEAEDRFRVLLDLSEEYRERTGGRVPAHVTIASNEVFAQAHPDIIRDYLEAFKETLQYVESHPEIWEEYAAHIRMESPAARLLLRQKMGANLAREWDSAQVQVQNEYLDLVHATAGDVLKVVPRNLIRDEFVP